MATPFSALGDADFGVAVQNLLPRGRAWPRSVTALLTSVAGAIGDALYLLQQSSVLLLETESFPATAVQLLPDFEADYGLPDPCSPADATVTERRAALLAKIASLGGQSAAYFIAVAAALGYTITITTWEAFTGWSSPWSPVTDARWRFAWQVNTAAVTISYFTGWSSPWDPLWSISSTELQCRLTQIAPAYSIFWIN